MKRSPMPRKRATKRRTTSPRCAKQRCGKPARDLGLCKTHLIHEADLLMSKRRREEHPWCQACGDTKTLQWAHVHSRRYHSIRWLRANSVVLCAACHTRYTHHPLEWEQWCRDQGIDWDGLRVRALHGPPMDPADVIRELRET